MATAISGKNLSHTTKCVADASGGIPAHWLLEFLPVEADQREYAREACMLSVTEVIADTMEREGLNRAQLADKLGFTKGHVSRLLTGDRNMTLGTLGELLWAAGVELSGINLAPFGVRFVPTPGVTKDDGPAETFTVASDATGAIEERELALTEAA